MYSKILGYTSYSKTLRLLFKDSPSYTGIKGRRTAPAKILFKRVARPAKLRIQTWPSKKILGSAPRKKYWGHACADQKIYKGWRVRWKKNCGWRAPVWKSTI
jgi:hypothetical protein